MSADLPPEAYTRETLQSAFDWLQTQPDVVRTNVHTPERLVSLYRRAQRLSDDDHPVSSKKFVTDLKSLASSLDQFSGQPQALQPPPPPPQAKAQETSQQYTAPTAPPPPPQAHTTQSDNSSEETTTETVKKASFEVTTNTRQTTTKKAVALDATTEARIQDVQKRFNLSSREESLRLLVALGYEKFTQIP